MSAFSSDHLSRLILRSIASALTPISLAHWAVVWVRPLSVIIRLVRLLFACSIGVAQRQFSGEYGPSLSGHLSSVCFGEGRNPMSAKNVSKESHLSATTIPRPPYRKNDWFLLLRHLLSIPPHIRCSGVLFNPCIVLLFAARARKAHLHLSDVLFLGFCKFPEADMMNAPHVHRHCHSDLVACSSDRPMMVRDPKTSPIFIISSLYRTSDRLASGTGEL